MKYKYFFLFFLPINSLAELVNIDPNYSPKDRLEQLAEKLNSDLNLNNYQDMPLDTQIIVNLKNSSNGYQNKGKKLGVGHDNFNLKKKDTAKKLKVLKPNMDLAEKKQLIGINRFEK